MKKTFHIGANEQAHIDATGQFVLVDECEGSVRIRINEKHVYHVNQGDQIKYPSQFESIDIDNLSNAQNKVVIRYGLGEFAPRIDHQKVEITDFPPMEVEKGNQPTNVQSSNDVTVLAGETKKVLSANGNRVEVLMQNISALSATVRVGSSVVSNTNGLQFKGSESAIGTISLNHGGEVWVHNPNAHNATLTVFEVLE